jgi:hypothetical protein
MKILMAVAAASVLFVSSAAFGQETIMLLPDKVSGDFTATVNSSTDDARLDRVCLYRVDHKSLDPMAEFACVAIDTGVAPNPGQEAESGEGLVYTITFQTNLVAGENQAFIARNIAIDTGVQILSDPSSNFARIPARPIGPKFVIVSP